MEQSDKDFLSAQFQAIRDHVDDKIHALKTSIAVQNQQYRIDMEQRDAWHKEHFETGKEVARMQTTIYGVKDNLHAVPCKPLSFLQGQLWMVWAIIVLVLPSIIAIAVKVWAK